MKLSPDRQQVVVRFLKQWPRLPYCQRFMKPLQWTYRNEALREDVIAVARFAVCEAIATYDEEKGGGPVDDLDAVAGRVLTLVKCHVIRHLDSLQSKGQCVTHDLATFSDPRDVCGDDEALGTEAVQLIRDTLSRQPRDVQDVVKLRYGLGTGAELSLAQIANIVGINEQTVRNRIARFHDAIKAAHLPQAGRTGRTG